LYEQYLAVGELEFIYLLRAAEFCNFLFGEDRSDLKIQLPTVFIIENLFFLTSPYNEIAGIDILQSVWYLFLNLIPQVYDIVFENHLEEHSNGLIFVIDGETQHCGGGHGERSKQERLAQLNPPNMSVRTDRTAAQVMSRVTFPYILADEDLVM
jgi:hypothetical protein